LFFAQLLPLGKTFFLGVKPLPFNKTFLFIDKTFIFFTKLMPFDKTSLFIYKTTIFGKPKP
jgi:hypothetical protein